MNTELIRSIITVILITGGISFSTTGICFLIDSNLTWSKHAKIIPINKKIAYTGLAIGAITFLIVFGLSLLTVYSTHLC